MNAPRSAFDEATGIFLAHCLQRRIMPVRLLYAGRAADRHIQLAEDYPDEYLDGRSEQEVAAVVESLGWDGMPPQLCDIGTSNGVHSSQFVIALNRHGLGCRRYLGLDFSSRLLSVARTRLMPCLPVDSHFAHWDIEAGPTEEIGSWRRSGSGLILCLLGGTLGNVDDPTQTLRNLRDSCGADDVLVLGVFLPPPPGEDIIGPYATPLMLDTMMIPLRSAGLTDDQLELRVEFVDNAIMGTVKVRSDLVVGTDLVPGGVPLAAGDEIRCFLSRRFSPTDAHRLFWTTGWHVVAEHTDAANSYLILTARPV